MTSRSRRVVTCWFTFMSWPDETGTHGVRMAGGWWFRFGRNGIGLSYKNLALVGYRPPFTERYGRDRQVAVRVGPHLVTFLRPSRVSA